MNLFTSNLFELARVTALLIFVASSGFTTVLHFCTMDASDCCDTSGASDHQACSDSNSSAPVAGASLQSADACYVNAVAGGLSAIQALPEKGNKAQNVHVLAVVTSAVVSLTPGTHSPSFTYSYLESVSPPSVEKYVLNDTFLI